MAETMTARGGERPVALACLPKHIPDELRLLPQWVCWRYRRQSARWKKVPVHPLTGRNVAVQDLEQWSDFTTAVARLRRPNPPDGIGFIFVEGGGLVGVDLDRCRDADTGELDERADGLVRRLNSYAEVSPSGTGVKVFARAVIAFNGRRDNVEVYSSARFFTVTGQRLPGTPDCVAERQGVVEDLVQEVGGGSVLVGVCPGPAVGALEGLTDDEVAGHIAEGGCGAAYRRLWRGESAGYPSESEADMALCGQVARLVGANMARVEAVVGRSARAERRKWRARADYRLRTVGRAVRGLVGRRTACPKTIQDNSGLTHTRPQGERVEVLSEDTLAWATERAEALAVEQGKPGCEFRRVFALARRLRAFADQAHSLPQAVRAYCTRAGLPYEEVWLRLQECWDWVRAPEGEGWAWACQQAREKPLPFPAQRGEPFIQAASLAYYLSLLRNEFPFPVEKVGEFLGMSREMGRVTVNLLVRDGYIKQTADANHLAGKAREYRFIGRRPNAGSPCPMVSG